MLSQIHQHLAGHPWQDRIHWFETLDSTNNCAKELARNGAAEGTVVIADAQTGGRGRLGRSFSSPAGMGIYLSVILRPDCQPEEVMHLTCAAGVAASKAVQEATGIQPSIKWTNDLVLDKRKLGGILTEISVDPNTRKIAWAIVGIGINCCQKPADFPEDIRQIACSLSIQHEDVPMLTAELIKQLSIMRRDMFAKKEQIMSAFQNLCITIGQEISIVRGDQVRHAQATGIDADGALLVTLADGSTEAVASGEVSIRGMYGYV